ncbi:hypothetical protein U14_00809 [Candidatus Moduliflexus flocculans]|uniref:DUF1257 domain-containing protein n=1 Tax=Candidatus Moduliflexus flocculans TaxID=1499966 RepID=A0A0S6VR17_9BACT|nr:hypothetical protein U14_00809 [Candidatus Moduliflexus flocculans]
MSRIITIQTQFRDIDMLKTCLETLECQVLHEPNGIKLRGASTPVELLVHAPFGSFGFRRASDGQYEIVGDDFVLGRQQKFIHNLTQQYAYRKVLKDAAAAGYQLVHEERRENREIRLVVRKW